MADLLGDSSQPGAVTLGTPDGSRLTGPVRVRGPVEGGGSSVRKVIPVVRRAQGPTKQIPRPLRPQRQAGT